MLGVPPGERRGCTLSLQPRPRHRSRACKNMAALGRRGWRETQSTFQRPCPGTVPGPVQSSDWKDGLTGPKASVKDVPPSQACTQERPFQLVTHGPHVRPIGGAQHAPVLRS